MSSKLKLRSECNFCWLFWGGGWEEQEASALLSKEEGEREGSTESQQKFDFFRYDGTPKTWIIIFQIHKIFDFKSLSLKGHWEDATWHPMFQFEHYWDSNHQNILMEYRQTCQLLFFEPKSILNSQKEKFWLPLSEERRDIKSWYLQAEFSLNFHEILVL